ncbi:MAG: glycosyltransferase family 2 protein [Chloroflexi bacterium]|nr:MAG: glycosyltransferase family 2 protein [Chloroflexota bacterium]
MKLSIIIPVYNEAESIETILKRVQATKKAHEIILVDDGSKDGTRDILKKLEGRKGLRVILHEKNQGKGAAVRTGMSAAKGDVLFMDQRQLLTFGYIHEAKFIPEYEKKVLMNEALSTNYEYYSSFYRDITGQRFSLIITEPLRTPVKDSSFEFGEENNAWVNWVSIPVLCYYQEIQTYKEVNVMLLIPKPVPDECSQYIPPKPSTE